MTFFSLIRFSSFLQGSICIYSPHTPPNFIQIQRHSSELHSISDSKSENPHLKFRPTQRALIYLWVATKTRSPSDWAHIYRVASAYTRHIHHQISSKSNATHQSYTRFPTQRALIYLWVATKTRSPPIELIFTGQIAHIVHMSPTKFEWNSIPSVRVTSDFRLKER